MYDYVIVGAGSAGCALAARLSEDPTVRVCLLESGPEDKSALIHVPAGFALLAQRSNLVWRFETVPQPGLGGRRGYQPRGRVLGGSSSINAMIYLRGHRQDYDGWAAMGNAGWGFDDVLPYFRRAEDNTRGEDAYHAVGGPLGVSDLRSPNRFGPLFVKAAMEAGYRFNPDFNGAEQEGVGPYQVTQRNGERASAARAYLATARGRPNLAVVTDAHATRVVFDGRRATGVEYQRDGRRELVTAGAEVIISAGALMSPQVLMLSGVGPGEHLRGHGLPVVHDLPGVGANLHDHIDVVQVFNARRAPDLVGVSPGGALRLIAAIREWRRARTGMLTTNFAEAGGFVRSSPHETVPDLQFHFVIAKLVDHGRKTLLGHGFSCHVCLLRPASRGSLRLASSDPMAAPLIDPAFLSERDDVDRLVTGFKAMRRVMHAPALAPYRGRELRSGEATSDEAIEAFVRQHADTIYHPVGTCRMGNGPGDVVDARLRVHGMVGLRVVDASIMPSIVGGNTNAPTIMIAEKAADMIRADRAQA